MIFTVYTLLIIMTCDSFVYASVVQIMVVHTFRRILREFTLAICRDPISISHLAWQQHIFAHAWRQNDALSTPTFFQRPYFNRARHSSSLAHCQGFWARVFFFFFGTSSTYTSLTRALSFSLLFLCLGTFSELKKATRLTKDGKRKARDIEINLLFWSKLHE